MATILNGVPLVSQPENSNICWYCSACMVAFYFEAGPRQGIPAKILGDSAIYPSEFITLASVEHLVKVPNQQTWTTDDLESLLRASGPIWCAGYWPTSGSGHVVVLTGAGNGTVTYNDPAGRAGEVGTISWYNKKLAASFAGCMMVRDPASVVARPKGGWGSSPTLSGQGK